MRAGEGGCVVIVRDKKNLNLSSEIYMFLNNSTKVAPEPLGWLLWWLQSDLIGAYAVASLFSVPRSVIYQTKAMISRISKTAN